MPDPSFPAPIEGPPDIANASGANFDPPWDLSNAEAIRRAYLHDEEYVKVLIKVGLLIAIFFVCLAVALARLAALHWMGEIAAPWAVRADWLAVQADLWLVAIASSTAGSGFLLRKSWAIQLEAIIGLGFLILVPLLTYTYHHSGKPLSIGQIAVISMVLSTMLVPLINLPDIRRSPVFRPEYREVIAATPKIRVRGKLGWDLKLSMLITAIAWFALIFQSAAHE